MNPEKHWQRSFCLFLPSILLLLAGCSDGLQEPAPIPVALKRVVVYSPIDTDQLRPLLDQYSAEFKIPVLYINDTETALFEKMRRKGLAEPADMYIGRDVGTLWYANDEDLFRPANSENLKSVVPAKFRDPDATWFGLSLRARPIVFNPGAVSPDAFTNYAALGDPQWRGRLCLSSSTLPDNRALVAMMIAEYGVREAEQIVRRWIGNLAKPVYRDDQLLANAIESGECDAGIASLSIVASRTARNSASAIAAFLPDSSDGGTHMNLIGAGVTRHASNPDGAQALLVWLLSAPAQRHIAAIRQQFPVFNDAATPEILAPYAALAMSPIEVARYGYLAQDTADLVVRAHYP